jgi:tetratricopeptide (TPR) repeat protein|tara:strand:+ start:950 stop:1411 length:462 start_codon:yes stop_codon:yes gene_type:complete
MRLKKMKNINNKKFILMFSFISIFFINNHAISESFFDEAKQKFDQKKYDDSKFLFQRNIVYNPKNAESYLYLAKIYKSEENEKEELKNLNTTLLLDPKNEEAMHLLINYELKKSNYSKVKELKENFSMICQKLCKEINTIEKSLSDIEPKNGS